MSGPKLTRKQQVQKWTGFVIFVVVVASAIIFFNLLSIGFFS